MNNSFALFNRFLKQESCAITRMTARCALYMNASHVSSQIRTRVKLKSVFPTPPLVSPKFLRVPLGVGWWFLGRISSSC